jgi:subtilisin family serine protease
MRLIAQRLLMLLALLLACAAAQAAEPEAPAAPAQVLVMLQVPAPHFRPGAGYSGAYRTDSGSAARRRVAQQLAAAHGLTLVSDWPMPVLGIECYVLALPPGAEAAQVASLLEADKRVAWAQPVAAFRSLASGDPLYPAQPGALRWKLDELHRTATGRAVTVAVIDSGVDERHPDLDGQVLHHQNFIDNTEYAAEPHGTAVAGIIAARAGNGIGIRGVAPQSRLLALRACRETAGQVGAQCDSFSLGKALNFAIMREPKVINLSLTGPPDRLLQRLLDVALLRGIAVVGAADPALADGGFPASWPGVFSVGGDAAPGRDIPSTLPGARYGLVSGSSYASAHVSGLLALVDELRPRATPPQLQAYLRSGPSAPIDACGALAKASGNCVCTCPVPGAIQAARNP